MPPGLQTVARPSTWLRTVSLPLDSARGLEPVEGSNREAREMREKHDMGRIGSHLVWPISPFSPVSRD
jgi:hypothetical protein